MALAPTGDSRRPKRYFPFAEGPRNCVGQSLAKVSLLATAATLLQHFSFRLADQVRIVPPLCIRVFHHAVLWRTIYLACTHGLTSLVL